MKQKISLSVEEVMGLAMLLIDSGQPREAYKLLQQSHAQLVAERRAPKDERETRDENANCPTSGV